MTNRLLAALGAVALVSMPLAAQDATPATPPAFKPFTAEEHARYTALGQRASRYFFEGQADSLLQMMAADDAERIGVSGVRQHMDEIAERAGMVLEVLDQRMTRREGVPQFWYEVSMSEFTREPLVIRWLIDENDRISGVGISPKSQARADPES